MFMASLVLDILIWGVLLVFTQNYRRLLKIALQRIQIAVVQPVHYSL